MYVFQTFLAGMFENLYLLNFIKLVEFLNLDFINSFVIYFNNHQNHFILLHQNHIFNLFFKK